MDGETRIEENLRPGFSTALRPPHPQQACVAREQAHAVKSARSAECFETLRHELRRRASQPWIDFYSLPDKHFRCHSHSCGHSAWRDKGRYEGRS